MKVLINALLMKVEKMESKMSNIYFKDGIILDITDIDAPLKEDVTEVIDAQGAYVTPGLIDAHTHLGMKGDSQGFEGTDHNERNDPVTPEMRAIDAVNPQDITFKEALEAGITTVASGPGSANVVCGQYACIKTYGSSIDKMVVKFPIAMKIAFGENAKTNYNSRNKTPVTRMGIAALLRELLHETVEYKNNENRKYNAKLEAMLPVINKEIPLKAHAHRADDILTAIRIAKEFDLDLTLEHCTSITEILDEIKDENYPLMIGPTFGARTKIELKDKSFKNVAKLSNFGKDFAIITDAPVIPLEYLPLCAGLAIDSGMDEWKALQAITINPAKYMGVEYRVGSIEIGKDADIVVWKNKPMVSVTSPKMVIFEGKVVYKH